MANVLATITPALFLSELKTFLCVTGTANDATLSELLQFACIECDRYINEPFIEYDPCTCLPVGGVDKCTGKPLAPVDVVWITDLRYVGIKRGVFEWVLTYLRLLDLPVGATANIGLKTKKTKDLSETYWDTGGVDVGNAGAATKAVRHWWKSSRRKPWR